MTEYVWPVVYVLTQVGWMVLMWKALSNAHDTTKTALTGTLSQPPVAPHPPPVVGGTEQKVSTPPAAPTLDPLIDDKFIAFVKKEEGFSAKAYGDFHQWSIGYGTKAKSQTEVITEPEAYARMITELNDAADQVKHIAGDAPRGVQQALIDLTYNAGFGWSHAGLGSEIVNKNYDEAKSHLLQYNHAGGKVDAGLTARREAEVSWFNSPL